MTVFRPDSPKKKAPAEFRAFLHGIFCGSFPFEVIEMYPVLPWSE